MLGKATEDESGSSQALKSPKQDKIEKVVSLYPYVASQDDELSFEGNEIIKVLCKDDSTWWKGESETSGKIGLFPSNYVQPYRSCKYGFHSN